MYIINLIGFTSSILLALCGFPLALDAFKTKRVSIGYPFLLMWFIGEIGTCFYVIMIKNYILILNYGFNILFLLILLYYKIFPKNLRR
jgi:uncharacterized protein with PQ loop repeat